jgi:hypothetical protein
MMIKGLEMLPTNLVSIRWKVAEEQIGIIRLARAIQDDDTTISLIVFCSSLEK